MAAQGGGEFFAAEDEGTHRHRPPPHPFDQWIERGILIFEVEISGQEVIIDAMNGNVLGFEVESGSDDPDD